MVYALIIRIQDMINKYCLVDSHFKYANLAIYLDGHMQAVSSLVTECVKVFCLEEACTENIMPPLTLIDFGNKYDIYRSNTYTLIN